MIRSFVIALSLFGPGAAFGTIAPGEAVFFLDFSNSAAGVRLFNGAKHDTNSNALEFTTALQFAELTSLAPAAGQGKGEGPLNGIKSMSIGGWFFPRRSGEQVFLFRALPEIGPLGERFFRRSEQFVTFMLGTDTHGFFMG